MRRRDRAQVKRSAVTLQSCSCRYCQFGAPASCSASQAPARGSAPSGSGEPAMHPRARRFLRASSISGRQNLPSRYGTSSVPTIPFANVPRDWESTMRIVLQRSMEQTGRIVQYIDLIRRKYDVWLLRLYWQNPKDVYISNYLSKFGYPKLWLLQYHLENTAYCKNQHQPWFNEDSCLHKQDMT